MNAKCEVLAAALLLSALVSSPASAQQAYPTRPIRLIVPYPPGGPTDIIGRTINERLGKRLGQQVIVDNRGGAATVIGADIAAHSPADGYTLLLATITTLAVNPALKRKLPYDPERDFAPVSMLAAQPYLLVVHPGVPATSVSQLIAHAKAQPGKLSFASAGIGAGAHLAAELFKYMARIDVVHIPYKGSGPAMTDVMGGQCAYMFAGISAAYPHTLSGKLNALAVSTAKRSAAVPEIPTISESGLPGYQMNTWNSLVVPRGNTGSDYSAAQYRSRRCPQRARSEGADEAAGHRPRSRHPCSTRCTHQVRGCALRHSHQDDRAQARVTAW
ncbi:MAG: tripartite tricarboxylate transporter substrate binding protein [Burkholderiales bacterium]